MFEVLLGADAEMPIGPLRLGTENVRDSRRMDVKRSLVPDSVGVTVDPADVWREVMKLSSDTQRGRLMFFLKQEEPEADGSLSSKEVQITKTVTVTPPSY